MNQYIFVADSNGERKATYLFNVGESEEDALTRVKAEYPNCTCFVGYDEPDFIEFVAKNKLYVDGHYVERPPYVLPLDDVKAAKISELKSIRDAKELEPVQYIDHLYDFDVKSFDRINAAIIALDQTQGTIGWTTADNSVVEVNADALRGVIASAAIRSNALHVIYRELKEAVNAATTVSEVESISWPEE